MSRLLHFWIALGVSVLVLMCGRAEAELLLSPGSGDPFVLTFDENGNGTVSVNGGPTVPLSGALLPDPSNGGTPALTFLLPQTVSTGDIAIREGAGGPIGDLLRFTNAQGGLSGTLTGDRMIFYSLVGGGALADTGFPANANLGFVGATENANGSFQYAPNGTADNIYNGTSNEQLATVPEPSSLTMMAMLGLSLAGWRRWTGKRRAA